MRKSIAAMLVLLFLTASCIMVAMPVSSSAEVTEDSWTSKTPMQVARSSLGVAAVNGKIYAIGGSTVTYASLTGPSQTGGIWAQTKNMTQQRTRGLLRTLSQL